MHNDDVSPARQQYLEIKREYPDTILFFRLGDFYETFDEDAEVPAARAPGRVDGDPPLARRCPPRRADA